MTEEMERGRVDEVYVNLVSKETSVLDYRQFSVRIISSSLRVLETYVYQA